MAQANSGNTATGAQATTRVAALVSAHGPLTPLYDADNRVHYVPESQVDDYLRMGFARDETRVETAHGELGGLLDRARSACDQLVADTSARGVIDRADDQALAVAHFAMNDLLRGFHALVQAIQTRHPYAEPQPTSIDVDGVTLRVDPNQADGASHAVHTSITPGHNPSQWTEPQRRAAGLITNVPPHLADPNDPFAYRQDAEPGSGDPATEHAAFTQVDAARLAQARRDAATSQESQP